MKFHGQKADMLMLEDSLPQVLEFQKVLAGLWYGRKKRWKGKIIFYRTHVHAQEYKNMFPPLMGQNTCAFSLNTGTLRNVWH